MSFTIFENYAISANRWPVPTVLCCVANIFTTYGEPAVTGKLPNMVAMQSDFHGIIFSEEYGYRLQLAKNLLIGILFFLNFPY